MDDYYSILGVSQDADDIEIKNAYRNLALKYHPDICKEPGAEERFKKINEAYEIFEEEQKMISTLSKSAYDLIKAQRYSESLSMFGSILVLKPNNIDALREKSNILFKLKRYAEAITVYDKILSKYPEDSVIWNDKGAALFFLGKYHDALTAYDRSLKIDPDYTTAKTNRNIAIKNFELSNKSQTGPTTSSQSKNQITGKYEKNKFAEPINTPILLTTSGGKVALWLSAIIAGIVILSRYKIGASNDMLSLISSLIILYIILFIFLFTIYWIITKVYPKSQNWGVILWTIAIVVIPIIIIFVLAVVSAFIFGLAGNISNINQQTNETLPLTTPQPNPTIVSTYVQPLIGFQTTPTQSLKESPIFITTPTGPLIEVPTTTSTGTILSIYPITIVQDYFVNIPYNRNQFYYFTGDSGDIYHISVSAGSLIDILVMDQFNYNIYQNAFKAGSAVSFNAVSYKSVSSKDFDYILPNSGTYYVVIDNSPFLTGGADAKTSVIASTKIILTGHF